MVLPSFLLHFPQLLENALLVSSGQSLSWGLQAVSLGQGTSEDTKHP